MAPSINILRALLADPELQDSGSIPAKAWLESRGDNVATGIVPFTGNLSIIARAQLANWFETHVAVDKKLRRYWLGHLPIAHACTLYLVALLQKNPSTLNVKKFNVNDDNEVLRVAWNIQTADVPEWVWADIDVDKECLECLEEEMFERSLLAGVAGNFQWGLDAGDHQDRWNPYAGTPPMWNHEDRESSEGEHEVSHYIILSLE